MRRTRVPLLLLGLFALQACSILEPDKSRQRRDLERQRSAWTALQISNYRYTAQQSCFCPPEDLHPVVLEVRNGSITSAHHAETGALVPRSPHSGYEQYYTVEQLFRVIEVALRHRGVLKVEYDPLLHYPRLISSYIPNTVDSGFTHTARDLVRLP